MAALCSFSPEQLIGLWLKLVHNVRLGFVIDQVNLFKE